MKTNVEIDHVLVTDALKVTGLSAQPEVVELALKLLIQMKNQESIRAWRGKIPWEGNLDHMRTDIEQ
jgi:Arc/MetJ family transcription regulator